MIWNDEMVKTLDPDMLAELARLQATLHSINAPGQSHTRYWLHG